MDCPVLTEWFDLITGGPNDEEGKAAKEKTNSAAVLFGDSSSSSSSSELSSSESEAEEVAPKSCTLPDKTNPFASKPAVR